MRHNYNHTRRKLYLPEYGRHIHKMVESLLEIEDRNERTRQAKAVIAVMGNINPMLRDTEDFKHKLWDHLFIMSDFRLDVDSPYPQPSRQELTLAPQKLRYPQSRITFKHYGKYLQSVVKKIAQEGDNSDTTHELQNVTRFMRAKSFEFNSEHPNNEALVRDIQIMAGSEFEINPAALATTRNDHRQQPQQRNAKRGKQAQQRNNNARNNKGTKGAKNNARHNQHK